MVLLATDGHYFEAEARKQLNRYAADSATGTADGDFALLGSSPHGQQLLHAQARREAGCAVYHGGAGAPALGHGYTPLGRYPDVFAEATVCVHTQVVTGYQHLVASGKGAGGGLYDFPSGIDAWSVREVTCNALVSGRGQRHPCSSGTND